MDRTPTFHEFFAQPGLRVIAKSRRRWLEVTLSLAAQDVAPFLALANATRETSMTYLVSVALSVCGGGPAALDGEFDQKWDTLPVERVADIQTRKLRAYDAPIRGADIVADARVIGDWFRLSFPLTPAAAQTLYWLAKRNCMKDSSQVILTAMRDTASGLSDDEAVAAEEQMRDFLAEVYSGLSV
jgi:hypothetical protein